MPYVPRNLNIVEWFDPTNKDHIVAYSHLTHTGKWPENFIPKDIVFPYMWNTFVQSKMVDNWIKHILKGEK
jgi:hypothetical protein